MHNQETKNCQNCKKEFTIESEDFNFYEKMQVPSPTWCPECRMVRRFSYINIWSLYKRKCDKCGQVVFSIYPIDSPNTIYCMPCWWKDDWDGTEYAMDYNPTKTFFEQLKELQSKTPWMAQENLYTMQVNSPYVNATGPAKNCYQVFWADYCENVFYSSYLNNLKDSLDCFRMEECELCYEAVGCRKCYRTFFSEECDSCTDTWFSRACSGLVNCFGCVNLRNKSYCIFNEQYSRESYLEKLKEFKLDSRNSLDNLRRQVFEFWNKYPRRFYNGNALNKNVNGDYIYESKNARDSYLAVGLEDGKFCQFLSVPKSKDCYDYSGWGDGAELVYESSVVGLGANNVKFSNECWPNPMNIEYSMYLINGCRDCFGCVNLKKKQNCILNKQYSKEEYEKLKTQIVKDMDKNPFVDKKGRVYKYGEYFPVELSLFAYNESAAMKFFPKTKEEAFKEGWKWYERKENDYAISVKSENLPDTRAEISDSILNEVIECSSCKKAYRITQGELNLMHKLNIPLPRQCSICRQDVRFSRTNLPKLYDRNCMKCNKSIRTSYALDLPEIVYCEKCYQGEFL